MAELMTLAFQLDQTRVVTFMLANAGSNRIYREVGVRERHHGISHHGGDPGKIGAIRTINRYHASLLAKALDRMTDVKEGEGTLLDHTLLVYGSGIGDGNRHNHDQLPILLAGGAAAGVRSGRHLRHERNTPLNDLFLAMLERAGCTPTPFGDGTRPLGRLG
jgi:hypothetical protein